MKFKWESIISGFIIGFFCATFIKPFWLACLMVLVFCTISAFIEELVRVWYKNRKTNADSVVDDG